MVLSTIKRLQYIYFSPSLDNFVFKLCYRWTTLLLVVFSFVVTSKLLLGDSFACLPLKDLPPNYADLKCYADGVYIRPEELAQKNSSSSSDPIFVVGESTRRYQSHYPWVNLLFLVHAFNFYLPHLVWKSYEGGYLHRLTVGVQVFFDKEEKRGLELCYLAKYVLITQGKHRCYTLMYISAEVGNYVISLAQTVWLIYFFDVTEIPESLSFEIKSWSDFKNFYFPSAGTCEIYLPGGTEQHTSCELPLNPLYMRMFVVLHAWYIILTILCGVLLVYRTTLFLASFRILVIRSHTSLAERSVLKSLCHRMSYSDWFFLSRLQKMMTDVDFAQMVDKIEILSQGKDDRRDVDKRISFFEDGMKDFDSSDETSPV